MTRFEKEVNGLLGEFWKKDALKEVEKCVKKANEEAIVEDDGAIKWKINNCYLMDDFCEKLEYAKYKFSRMATRNKREIQVSQHIEEYRKNHQRLSEEEKSEMNASFGKGKTIVNIITGEIYITR